MSADDLTPEQEARLAEAADRFRRSMQKLGIGVTIQVGDDDPVVVTKPPPPDDPSHHSQ